MKKITLSIFFVSVLLVFFSVIRPPAALGLTLSYTPPCLDNVSGLANSGFTPCPQQVPVDTIAGYIDNIYRFLVGISGILALGMIVAGAIFISVSTGSVDKQSEGRSMITSAIFGVILVFASYLLLNTINPALTTLKEPSASVAPSSPSGNGNNGATGGWTGGQTGPACDPNAPLPPGTMSISSALSSLGGARVESPCSTACAPACVGLWGLPLSTAQNIASIAQHCRNDAGTPCDVTIVGGTESTTKNHGPGQPTVDFSFNTYLARYLSLQNARANIVAICTDHQNSAYSYKCSLGNNEVPGVIHVQFSP